MKYTVWIGLVCLFFLNGCATVKVSSDYDTATDFSRYHTYAWQSTPPPADDDMRINNDLFDARVKRAVDRQLAQLGIAYSENSPDFLVRYTLHIEQKTALIHDEYDYPLDIGWHYGYYDDYGFGFSTRVYEQPYDVLTLIIEFVDTDTDTLIWQGIAQDEFDPMVSPERKDKQIDEAVTGMLAKFEQARKIPPVPE